MYDLLDDSTRAPNPNVLVTTGTVLIKLQPILNAPLAEELVAVVALLGFPRDLEAYLAEHKSGEILRYFESANAIGIVADCPSHFFCII